MVTPWREFKFLLLVVVVLVCVRSAGPRTLPTEYRSELARCDSLHAAGRYAATATAADSLLQRIEADEGPDSLEAAAAIRRIVAAMIAGRQTANPACRELAERALAIHRQAHGDEHPEVAGSLVILGLVLEQTGEYEEARDHGERALAIRESTLAPDDPDLATSLIAVANLRARMGDYEGLAELYERALGILETALGPGHRKVANACLNYAIYCKLTGDYVRSRELNERALASFEAQLGPGHPDIAQLLYNLGNLLVKAGQLADGREAYQRALVIREQALGPNHLQTARTVEGLALLEQQAGNLLPAQDYALRAAAIYETGEGASRPRVIHSQSVLANIEFNLGDNASAEHRASRALEMQVALVGEDHPRNAELLDLIGKARHMAGDLDGSIAVQRRALAISERCLPADHPDIARSLRALAAALIDAGDLVAAGRHLRRAATIDEEARGPISAPMVDDLYLLGKVTWLQGDPVAARRLLEQCVDVSAEVIGTEHPRHAVRMRMLAMVLADSGFPVEALAMALEVERASRVQLRTVVRGLPETQALRYTAVRAMGLDLALSILAGGEIETPQVMAVWDELVRSRSVVLDEMAARRRRQGNEVDAGTEALLHELAVATRELAWLMVSSDDSHGAAASRERYDQAYQRQEQLGRELAQQSSGFQRGQDQMTVGLADVIGCIPAGSGLVAYVRYEERQSAASPREPVSDVFDYAALVWPAAGQAAAFVPLGAATQIDLLVSRWRDEVGQGTRVTGRPVAEADRACRAAGMRLRQAIWDPIASLLGDAEQVFVVPDGTLNMVDFAALPGDAKEYLVEFGPLLHLATAERDLAAAPPASMAAGGLLALGDPDFDAECTALAAGTHGDAPREPRPAAAAVRGEGLDRPECQEFRRLVFAPLPATADEVAAIGGLWEDASGQTNLKGPVLLLTGSSASEVAFKRLAGEYRSLHVATHGFFLDGQYRTGPTATRGVGGIRPAGEVVETNRAPHPLLVSGLALAGANTRRSAGPGDEDGIVMAAEIATMNLVGVRWVVLSACESGLGELHAGEGVLGLRRAFHIAGATTVIMSLWSVDDEMARRWMHELYRARISEGLTTAEAVRAAGRRLLAARRAEGLSTHPYHWAGFIAAGDWR